MTNYSTYNQLRNKLKEDPTKKGEPTGVDNNIRSEWNKYLSWLEKEGFKGHPELDKNDMGFKMLEKYRKVNPATPLTREMIPVIQKDFTNYRQWVLDKTKLPKGTPGRVELTPGTTEENFMKDLSIVDGIPGQRTTSFVYPQAYLQTFDSGNLIKKESQGFATIK